MPCAECARLVVERERLKGAYVVALNKMLDASSISSREFVFAKGTSDGARLDADVARLELEAHKRIHSKAT